ncbi:MAG: nicotinate-nucleotide adenylyltransferase [Bacilli bacterium]|nr:nicotinate-nucleotide adenylyltransferase [Bacilli bacterium]
MNRIIFGGGFDPIHLGHINMAIMAQKAYPGEVIFVPAKIAVWKSSSIHQEHKLAMVQIAIKNIPGFSVDTFELDQPEQPRSYQTVEYFMKKYPNDKLYFLIGQDQVNAFHEWAKPEEIAKNTQIIYYERPKYELNEVNVNKYHMIAISGPTADVSSSDIRELRSAYLQEDVIRYIEDNELYFIKKVKPLLKESRFKHSKSVAHMAYQLAEHHHLDFSKAYVAGILHDIAKGIKDDEELRLMKEFYPGFLDIGAYAYHQFLGAMVARDKFGVADPEILDAIKYHTTGRKKMGWLEKLVFVSDKIEPTRPYDSSDLIKAMYDDFEQGFITVLKANREFLISKDKMVDNRFTADCFKYYLGL